MKKTLFWICLNVLFGCEKFKKILRYKNKDEVQDFLNRASSEEKYELAAYLNYYIDFKFNKENKTLKMKL